MLKIFEVYINNGKEFSDEDHITFWIVAEDMNAAIKKTRKELNRFYNPEYYKEAFYEICPIETVDGYKISVNEEESHNTYIKI